MRCSEGLKPYVGSTKRSLYFNAFQEMLKGLEIAKTDLFMIAGPKRRYGNTNHTNFMRKLDHNTGGKLSQTLANTTANDYDQECIHETAKHVHQ